MQKLCSQCGAPFECCQAPGCWCAHLPNTMPIPGDRTNLAHDCLCPKCLAAAIAAHSDI